MFGTEETKIGPTIFKKLWEADAGKDISFIVNGRTVRCHRCIVQAASKEFEKLLNERGNICEITIDEICYDTFYKVIQYIYTDELCLNDSHVLDYMEAAKRFLIEPLNALCLKYIEGKITPELCWKLLAFTRVSKWKEDVNKPVALRFIAKNPSKCKLQESTESFSISEWKLMIETAISEKEYSSIDNDTFIRKLIACVESDSVASVDGTLQISRVLEKAIPLFDKYIRCDNALPIYSLCQRHSCVNLRKLAVAHLKDISLSKCLLCSTDKWLFDSIIDDLCNLPDCKSSPFSRQCGDVILSWLRQHKTDQNHILALFTKYSNQMSETINNENVMEIFRTARSCGSSVVECLLFIDENITGLTDCLLDSSGEEIQSIANFCSDKYSEDVDSERKKLKKILECFLKLVENETSDEENVFISLDAFLENWDDKVLDTRKMRQKVQSEKKASVSSSNESATASSQIDQKSKSEIIKNERTTKKNVTNSELGGSRDDSVSRLRIGEKDMTPGENVDQSDLERSSDVILPVIGECEIEPRYESKDHSETCRLEHRRAFGKLLSKWIIKNRGSHSNSIKTCVDVLIENHLVYLADIISSENIETMYTLAIERNQKGLEVICFSYILENFKDSVYMMLNLPFQRFSSLLVSVSKLYKGSVCVQSTLGKITTCWMAPISDDFRYYAGKKLRFDDVSRLCKRDVLDENIVIGKLEPLIGAMLNEKSNLHYLVISLMISAKLKKKESYKRIQERCLLEFDSMAQEDYFVSIPANELIAIIANMRRRYNYHLGDRILNAVIYWFTRISPTHRYMNLHFHQVEDRKDDFIKLVSLLCLDNIEIWTADVNRESAESESILESKKKWLDEYERTYGKEIVKTRKVNHKKKHEYNVTTNSHMDSEQTYAKVLQSERDDNERDRINRKRFNRSDSNTEDNLESRPNQESTYERSNNGRMNGYKHRERQGFRFTPTPKGNKVDLIKDTEEFCRKLRLRECFQDNDYDDGSLVRNRSNFKPKTNRDKHLEDYINCLKSSAQTNPNNQNIKDNISRSERNAIENLSNDATFVIKEADKGGAICIMDREHYKKMVMDQLNDRNFYHELTSPEDAT
ncbi:hypothetical protein FSP39_020612 [Pinctada imbricata]|uniref:BTB domain-containing protein n=1 Tax=Pinctada imbricata TaxID=66713 RepID=A0AA89BMV9_PINIB|nr:hypothetical protein FSP39_020612 [Pinctada imbricata]